MDYNSIKSAIAGHDIVYVKLAASLHSLLQWLQIPSNIFLKTWESANPPEVWSSWSIIMEPYEKHFLQFFH